MNIDSIQNGIVIDHIAAGNGMKLYELLELDKLDCSVALLRNVVSQKLGKKDIIKIDAEIEVNFDVIGYVDPGATVNVPAMRNCPDDPVSNVAPFPTVTWPRIRNHAFPPVWRNVVFPESVTVPDGSQSPPGTYSTVPASAMTMSSAGDLPGLVAAGAPAGIPLAGGKVQAVAGRAGPGVRAGVRARGKRERKEEQGEFLHGGGSGGKGRECGSHPTRTPGRTQGFSGMRLV